MDDKTIELIISNLPDILLALGTVVTALGVIIAGFLNYKRTGDAVKEATEAARQATEATRQAKESVEASKLNAEKIEEVHQTVNGKTEELLKVTKALGFSEGEKKGTETAHLETALKETAEDVQKVELVKKPKPEIKTEDDKR